MEIINFLSYYTGLPVLFVIITIIIIYFLPSILASFYWVFHFWFLIINFFLGFTPAPWVILTIKAIKNKNLYYNEESWLELLLSKKEQLEIEKMKQEKEKRLTTIKSPIQEDHQKGINQSWS